MVMALLESSSCSKMGIGISSSFSAASSVIGAIVVINTKRVNDRGLCRSNLLASSSERSVDRSACRGAFVRSFRRGVERFFVLNAAVNREFVPTEVNSLFCGTPV